MNADTLAELFAATRSDGDLSCAVSQAARALGFTSWAASAILDSPAGPRVTWSLAELPHAYKASHFDDTQMAGADPVMQHARRSNLPLPWDQAFYETYGRGSTHEILRSHGLWSGVIGALHLPDGRHFCLGLDSDIPLERKALTQVLPQFHLLLAHAQAAQASLADAQLVPDDPWLGQPLTAREVEFLQWTAAGKTTWEIGQILGLAESTVNKHADAALRKLGCTNRAHAVATAIRRRLID